MLSARSVIDALDVERTEVVPIGITRDGRWHRLSGPPALPSETGRMPEVTEGSGTEVELAAEAGSRELVSADGSREPIDVVFPVLHGPFGEDGTIQGLFELAGVPYVGAGVLGSAIGMDKDVQKQLFLHAGLPVGPFETVHEKEWADDPESVEASAEALGYPLFTKPTSLGSSVGVSKVGSAAELAEGLEEAFRYARYALLEKAADGAREIECAVLGNDEPVASVAGEIVPKGHDFYDYEAKYLDEDGAQLLIPADLKPEVLEDVQRLAVAAFRTTRCAGMARVDFFLLGEDRAVAERGQHDPRVHLDLDVPEAVGGIRAPVRGARRAAPRPRDRAARSGSEEHGRSGARRLTAGVRRWSPTPGSARAESYRWTTGQVSVRVMPSTAWIRATTSLPRSSTLSASARTITS